MKTLYLTILIVLSSFITFAQCSNDTLTIGNDTTLCTGQSITLSADQAYLTYLWSNSSTNSSITINTSGIYSCTATIIDSSNLVTNGDFSLGNFFFTSNYIYGTGGPYGLLSYEGQYAISTNASLTHNNFSACTDHTTGTGNFMIVNGASTANQAVWIQTITISPSTDYIFSAWFTSVNPSNPAILNFSINGVAIGPNVNLSSTTCLWQNFYHTWTSGPTQTSATISITNQNINPSGNDFAIDDIYFAQVCQFHDTVNIDYNNYPSFDLGTDTLICENDSLILKATSDSISTYLWNDNSTDSTLTVYNSGIYSVNVANGYCTAADTISVQVIPYPIVNLGNDTLICDGNSLILDAGNNSGGILWSDNSTNQVLNVTTSGLYWVEVDSLGCKTTDSISIQISQGPNPTLDAEYEFCDNDSIKLSPGNWTSYQWSTNETTQFIYVNPNTPTIYSVIVWDDDGCKDSTKTKVSPIEMPDLEVFASNDTICLGTALTIQATGADAYKWNDGSIGDILSIYPNEPRTYCVTGTNSLNGTACTSDTCIYVFAKDCNTFYVANAFSPNGDGRNDYFGPVGEHNLESYEFFVYSRWGILIFYTNNINKQWDGKDKNGMDVEPDVYTYLFKIKEPNIELYQLTGTVQLIR